MQCVTNPRYRILNLFFPFSDRQASESKREKEGREKYQMQWMTYTINERFCNLFHESIETQPKKHWRRRRLGNHFTFLSHKKNTYIFFLSFFSFFFFCHARVDRKIYLRWISLSGKSTLLFALAATTASIKNNNNFPLTPYNYKTRNIIYI